MFKNIDLNFAAIATTRKPIDPVFMASRAGQLNAGQVVNYELLDMETNTSVGSFDKRTGQFVVHTPGLYLFHFNGVSHRKQNTYEVVLRVNEMDRASPYCSHSSSAFGSVAMSALLPLKTGDKVDVFVTVGILDEDKTGWMHNRFSGLLVSC